MYTQPTLSLDHCIVNMVEVIVKAKLPGIYGSKLTESEGALGLGQFTAINPWQLGFNFYISHLIGP